MFDCFDAFRQLITTDSSRENNASVTGSVNRTSTFGLFLRRIILAFNQLMFDGVVRLFDAIVVYRNNSQNDEEIPISSSMNLPIFVNPKSAEKYIFQIAQKIECK